MSIPFGHQELHNRYCFAGELEIITPLRISSGRASDETDAPCIRTLNGIPYIPGSSLRGAVRSEVERIIKAVGETAGLRSCTLFEEGDCSKKVDSRFKELKEKEEKKVRDKRKSDDELLVEAAEEELCDVCCLFGSTMYGSRLVFEDCLPVNGAATDADKHIIRDGVGIDRDTGAARDGVKFDYEVVEEGEFKFRMVAENVNNNGKDKKLINLILGLLKQGLHVGGKRAGGLGKIKLKEVEKVTGFSDPKSLWEALVSGQDINQQKINWEEVIRC